MNEYPAGAHTLIVICLWVAIFLIFIRGYQSRFRHNARLTAAELKSCSNVGIDQATAALIKAEAGSPISELASIDENGDEGESVGVQFAVPASEADGRLERLRARLRGSGCLAFQSERHYNIGGTPDMIAIIKATDQYEIVRVRGTSAPNYDMEQSDILAKLKKWEKRYPFEIIGAEMDLVELRFETVPANIDAFAAEVYDFCPDTVDQGAGSLSALAEYIEKGKRLMLWWD